MYFDEEVVLDVRLNVLNQFIDYFVIVESRFTHKGDPRNLKFDLKKFNKFKDKIIYLIYEDQPKEIEIINNEDGDYEKTKKYISNAIYRENSQRNYIKKGLVEAEDSDIILISDVDEIPNLSSVNFNKINEKIILFKQEMFYYKFNLHLPNLVWSGTKACKKKDLLNPQWLRNIKDRKYSFFRIDTLFSKTKYKSIKIFNNGGWHFTNIKTAKEIEYKLKSYLHHREFDVNPLTINQIDEIIKNKKAIYNLNVDKSISKIGSGNKLEKFEINKLPIYIQKNLDNLKQWIE
jgi:beta-1,4-mannosyl-glycoprotein beta-1,4-N-acetylglucosaminyltransferase|tara:strand:- start:301 stop:1170 length:870 start_codon:yes stop_codon:yes gene_type:complete